ncbi:fibroblast growth factor 2 isoform X1 [Molothrus ater]|uniref:fibroblast growth factor 2 isoform X1 n=1 Tax=Molothrus ater TaxID=84834 RepID=UPI00174CDC03|nr:fibroblast growth factor 2 isoform X1 [Molothrus ater]XP_036237602.1 fibroblast growth factor 2 isoform X1 [Molothrus ater]XP_054370491.1 fibroblast growth factor 2 isoform X1 [Molothrus ater]
MRVQLHTTEQELQLNSSQYHCFSYAKNNRLDSDRSFIFSSSAFQERHKDFRRLHSARTQNALNGASVAREEQEETRRVSILGCDHPELSVKLQLQAEERGVVSIKGVSANRFLAMKEDGRLLALKYATEECFFFERLESNNYNTYRSRKYSDWYVALKRTGQYKPGPKTGPGQKAILFLPMSAKS